MPANDADLLTTKEAAGSLGLAEHTLRMWRYECRGPAFIRLSARAVRYRREDLDAWVEGHRVETQR